MNKILLALAILGAGAGGFLTARQSTIQLQHKSNAAREAWLAQTQFVAAARSDRVNLIEQVRELKQALTQPRAGEENALWSALQTNRAGQLSPELREHLLVELGFNWKSSEDFIVVSKETLRELHIRTIRHGKLTDMAATVLGMTPEERGQIEAAMQRVQTDFKDWVLAHAERSEPKDDVVAHYTLAGDPTMSISNNFVAGILDGLGRERSQLIISTSPDWMNHNGIRGELRTMIVSRYLAGNERRLRVETQNFEGRPDSRDLWQGSKYGLARFPDAFRPIFPNGWADVAKREGFEMPEESQEK
jgi:hypothetical protein